MSKFVIHATWDDVSHLTQQAKDELWESIPAYQREARSKGIPSLGSGAIYPIAESDLVVPEMPIPDHWPRAYGMDVGWNRTAVVWCALNRDTDVLYCYSEHYRGEAEPVVHVQAIQSRGKWIRGAIDPAARGRGQIDGRELLQMYTDLGLDLTPADNAVESGIYHVMTRMSSGRLKIFPSLANTLSELRLYRRDERGKVVKARDHLMDALRYVCVELHNVIQTKSTAVKDEDREYLTPERSYASTGWMS